ncbi:unnamed protein product [Arabis nemorensis]|uniref:Uncharacterized protein n=1 Tax=Arabis nemorensis TaxID=586526 RepID=A0A565C1M6_9BRAS|nr:unnamed protein product [Arabis nemorensis]
MMSIRLRRIHAFSFLLTFRSDFPQVHRQDNDDSSAVPPPVLLPSSITAAIEYQPHHRDHPPPPPPPLPIALIHLFRLLSPIPTCSSLSPVPKSSSIIESSTISLDPQFFIQPPSLTRIVSMEDISRSPVKRNDGLHRYLKPGMGALVSWYLLPRRSPLMKSRRLPCN